MITETKSAFVWLFPDNSKRNLYHNYYCNSMWTFTAVADLHSKSLDPHPLPIMVHFVHFQAVFGNIWPNNRLTPAFGIGAPCKILGPSLHCEQLSIQSTNPDVSHGRDVLVLLVHLRRRCSRWCTRVVHPQLLQLPGLLLRQIYLCQLS